MTSEKKYSVLGQAADGLDVKTEIWDFNEK